jgi:folate-binding protein YgfZ
MPRVSPIRNTHALAEASFQTWGPEDHGVEMVETFGEIASEYASLRRGCALFDMTNRGTIEITGADRLDFLDRMITQQVKGLAPYRCVRSFWLNRKGRIDADLRVLTLEDRVLLDLDWLTVDRARSTLDAFVITEDVAITDASAEWSRLAIHGPTTLDLLQTVATHRAGAPLADLSEGAACLLEIAGAETIVDRWDECAEVGAHLWLRSSDVERVWLRLVEAGSPHDDNGNGDAPGATPQSRIRLRPGGWHAYNIARVEAGTPLYNIDFGEQSLPGETGVLRDRVHFRKGCYLGQEVVARMDALGKPKQILVALRFDHDANDRIVQPFPGAHVMEMTEDAAETVGAITSSTISPMLGGEAIAFAQVRTKYAENKDANLVVAAEGSRVRATVQDSLRFWTKP